MNLEKRFLRVYAVMVVCVSFVILTGLALHRHWLTDVAGILLGLTIQVLILAVSGLALRGQALNHRPRAAKILLVIIISAMILNPLNRFGPFSSRRGLRLLAAALQPVGERRVLHPRPGRKLLAAHPAAVKLHQQRLAPLARRPHPTRRISFQYLSINRRNGKCHSFSKLRHLPFTQPVVLRGTHTHQPHD